MTIIDEIIEVAKRYKETYAVYALVKERLDEIKSGDELECFLATVSEQEAADLASKIFWLPEAALTKYAKESFYAAYPGSKITIPVTSVMVTCSMCLEPYGSKVKRPNQLLCDDCREIARVLYSTGKLVIPIPDDPEEKAHWAKATTQLRKLNYQEYLRTEYWKEVRRLIHIYYGERCMLCKSGSDLRVHHNSYDRLGCEYYSDLILVCHTCHSKIHGKG